MVVPLEGQPPVSIGNRQPRAWIPLPFRAYFWVPLVLFLLLAAIGLEVALRISNKNQGFPMGKTPRDDQILHYAYVSTLIPGLIALLTVGFYRPYLLLLLRLWFVNPSKFMFFVPLADRDVGRSHVGVDRY